MAKDPFSYGGDDAFRDQIQKLKLDVSLETIREKIRSAAHGEAVVTPTQIMEELVGAKMEEDNLEDPEAAQAFAMSFLALWNEAVASRPEDESSHEANAAWRAGVQAQIEAEAKEARKPYIAPDKPGRNDPCNCGSGKKYKKCHGA